MPKPHLIIWAGISGATLAERLASIWQSSLVIDKRNHIWWNCYDFINDDGILVPKYGPHFFHTNFEDVWKYVSQFTEWTPYEHRVLSVLEDGTKVPMPVNITTVNTIFGLNIETEAEMQQRLADNIIPIDNPQNSRDSALSRVGQVLYDKLFKNYTKKQRSVYPEELDALVMNRIPVRTDFEDRYFTDKYQALPRDGYTRIFENMLNHPLIEVQLNTDFDDFKDRRDEFDKIFYTGRIDSYFWKLYEPLQYRSLRFEYETLDQEYAQDATTENYPNHEAFTRITEHKRATWQKHPKTTIIREYSTRDWEPYYPVPTQRNKDLYAKYKSEAEKLENQWIYFVGRLAEYKYFNMDQAFKNALELFERIR